MRRTILGILTVAAVASIATSAGAVWIDRGAYYVRSGYRVNSVWPWPYICPDRAAVREPFAMMIDNGWRRQNLLGPHHFDPVKGTLTTAGELKVHWIMTQTPPERRTIFVERSLDSTITTQRIEAAREYAVQVATDGRTPQVTDTHLVSEGRPAAVVDATFIRFHESMPPPVLPAPVGTSSSLGQ
jgi:hypothetical protein